MLLKINSRLKNIGYSTSSILNGRRWEIKITLIPGLLSAGSAAFAQFFPEFFFFLITHAPPFFRKMVPEIRMPVAGEKTEAAKENFAQDQDADGLVISNRLHVNNLRKNCIPEPHDDPAENQNDSGNDDDHQPSEFFVSFARVIHDINNL
jgi:hypothetical protein